ncbi:RICIN domain-containing protein [Actinosynnema sp. NPDC047251]|uniref:RICIN domain-containing protein n=1 Tax=Saccharothrix espanaensis TaxID=103731 RepID=UPI0011DCC6DD|nr:RICIN domain-containing protein [Saccharothrix espanaensis]
MAAALGFLAPAIAGAQADGPVPPAGNFMIQNSRTGYCADLPDFGPGTVDGPVNQWHCRPGPGDNQTWRLIYADPGSESFAIQNISDKLCMDVPFFGSVERGAKVTEYHCRPGADDNQDFTLLSGSPVRFKHVKTGFCLAAPGGLDTRLTLDLCSSGLTDWRIVQ